MRKKSSGIKRMDPINNKKGVSTKILLDKSQSEGQKAKKKSKKNNSKGKKVEEKLIKANHLYSFISHINQTISKVQNEHHLFNEACRIAVENGNFKMAWLGLADMSKKKIKLASSAGVSKSLIDILHNKTYDKKGPTEHLLKGNEYYVINDISKDKEISWQKLAHAEGIKSFLTLAIKKSNKTVACLYIYSTEINFFDKAEIDMLLEAAHDISFCLDNIESKKLHKLAEAEILQSEKRFRMLTEKGADMVTLSNKNGDFLYGSPSIKKIFGYSEKKITSTLLSKVIHPDDLKQLVRKSRSFLKKNGASFTTEFQILHKNGKWIWCEATLTNHLNESGINAIVTNFRDISVRKENEIRIRFDSNNLTALINNSDDLMWSVDTSFNLITSNAPFENSLKKSFNTAIKNGESVLPAVLPINLLEQYKKWYQRAFNGEYFSEVFFTQEPQDTWIENSFHPIIEDSQIIGTACHSRDITYLKKSEILLNKSKAFTTDILNSLSSNIAVIDANGNILEVNESWNQFSIKNNEPDLNQTGIGSNYLNVCKNSAKSGDSFAEKVLAEFNSIFKNEKSNFHFEYPCVTTFSESWYCIHVTKLKSDESKLVVSHENISARKIAELDKKKITEDLIQRNRDLEQFTFIVSHNLRAPLANIIGISNVVSTEDLEPDELKDFINGLLVSANSLDNVLKDLNTILQVKRDINDKKEMIYFSKLVKEISFNMADVIEKNHVTIIQNFGSAKKIFSLRAYIYSIFFNLISNSIKYCQPNLIPVIEISSESKKGKTVLTFKDNGLGIDLKSNINKVFGLYQRFHRNVEGKGMGMFMTKSQVEALGGAINIQSEPLKGTTITIEI